jgi:hypothetical protein
MIVCLFFFAFFKDANSERIGNGELRQQIPTEKRRSCGCGGLATVVMKSATVIVTLDIDRVKERERERERAD